MTQLVGQISIIGVSIEVVGPYVSDAGEVGWQVGYTQALCRYSSVSEEDSLNKLSQVHNQCDPIFS